MNLLNKPFSREVFLFITILILALSLRVFGLSSFPAGLHYQEATIGWRAQNLINTGHDEFGRKLPFYFSNWTEIEMPLTTYLVLPFVAIDKTNIFWLRLPFAILGTLLVAGSIFLTQKLFPSKKNLGLWVGFVMAVSPATIWFSRFANPQILAFCLLVWGVYFIFSLRSKFLGSVIVGLSLFASLEVLFLVVGLLIFLIIKRENFKQLIPIIISLAIFLGLFLLEKSFYISWLDNNLSLFRDNAIIGDINLIRGHNTDQNLPEIINKIFFNKGFFIVIIIKNMLSYFSLSYIFARGDGLYLNGLSTFGLMPLSFLPFFIVGFYNFIKQKYSYRALIFSWVFLATISSFFILNTPDTKRFLYAMLPLSILVGIGFLSLRGIFRYLVLILVLFNIGVIGYDGLFKEMSRQQSVFHDNSLNTIKYLNGEKGNIWVTDSIDKNIGPKIGYLNQVLYSNSSLSNSRSTIYKGWVNQIDNFYIGNKDQLIKEPEKFQTIIKSEKEILEGCFLEKTSFGEGDKKLILMVRAKCREDGTIEQ